MKDKERDACQLKRGYILCLHRFENWDVKKHLSKKTKGKRCELVILFFYLFFYKLKNKKNYLQYGESIMSNYVI